MELWTFKRYERPQLRVDDIECDEGLLTLRCGDQECRIALGDTDAAADLAGQLNELRDADSPLWDMVRQSDTESPWFQFASFLDQRSLISEEVVDAAPPLSRQTRRILQLIADNVVFCLGRTKDIAPEVLSALVLNLRRKIDAGRKSDAHTLDVFDSSTEPNFFIALLLLEVEYLRYASAATLCVVDVFLEGVQGRSESIPENRLGDFSEIGDLYDERDLAAHLWLLSDCIVKSCRGGADRFAIPAIPALSTARGLEFMRQLELVARSALRMWGENPYVAAIKKLARGDAPIVAGPFIEQYHVTRRFVEIVAPLLSKRLDAAVRRLLFQYYDEEVGHEALESTTCEALGVSEGDLQRALPLPLHFAFVDVLTLLAHEDPISSFAAIMAIEGVFGEPPKMSLRLAAVDSTNARFTQVVGDHEQLNEDLNHNSIPRDLFTHISAVGSATQSRAMKRILFLLELNHRAWAQIAEYYGPQLTLHLQGQLGEPFLPSGVVVRQSQSQPAHVGSSAPYA